jgi:BirA family biotin operon repressor/biotin-[acetyl-CoA-carboxylase] ligase
MPAPWPLEDLWLQLSPSLPGITLELLPSIDSTNSELMRRARNGHTDPVLLVAETQTAGRGRLGRRWVSSPGDSLTFSLGLMLSPHEWSGLSLAVGVALVEALESSLHLAPGLTLGLKWPNDLWCDPGHGPHKLGGILIETANAPETRPASAGRYAVIGVGLNVRTPQAVDSTIPPLGLQALSAGITAPELLRHVLPGLLQTLLDFGQHGFAPLQTRFTRRDLLLNQPVHLSDGREGVARGVDSQGALQLDTVNGRELVHSAEISVRPRPV